LIREGGAVPGRPTAHPGAAGVAHGAEEAVVAGRSVGLVRVGADAGRGIAGTGVVALIEGFTDDRVVAGAGPGLAGGRLVAGHAVGLLGVGADTARRVTDAGDVALIEGGADNGVRRHAGAGLAGVGLGAGIAIAAGAAVRLLRIGAGAARRVTDPGVVALIERGADDRAGPDAGARLAGVALRAGVAVVGGRAGGLVGVGAGAGGAVTGAG